MTELVIIGAAGFGREAVDIARAVQSATQSLLMKGVIDDNLGPVNAHRLREADIPYLGTTGEWLEHPSRGETQFVVAIGNPTLRRYLTERFLAHGWLPGTLVHPSVGVGHGTRIGAGAVLAAGAQISHNVWIEQHVHVNPNATIGHDTRLGAYVSINPGAVVSGDCVVDEDSLVGAGAVILQGLRVGRGSTVGAAACVVRDVPPETTVKGVPAK